jgi:hypothetical protein
VESQPFRSTERIFEKRLSTVRQAPSLDDFQQLLTAVFEGFGAAAL